MNFKDFYYNIFYPRIITEDYESSVNQITKIVNNNGLPPESIDNILDVYNNVSVDDGRERAKKDSDLVALTYMYMVRGNIDLSVDEIKRKYAAYLNSETSVGKKILSDYVTNLQNEIKSKGLFKPDKKADRLALINTKTIELLKTIHRYRKKKEFSETVPDEDQDKVYEDKSIVVFKADSKAKCIYYGRNTNLCISTKSGNYYWKYRMGKMRDDDDGLGMTTYFVIPKDRVGDELIVIDAMGNENGSSNTFGYTIVEPSGKQVGDLYNISKKELISEFPSLEKPFDQNVFKFLPYGEKEKRFQFIDEGIIGFDELKGYEDYEMYIQTDQFDSKNWNVIEKNVNDKDFRKLLLLASELEKNIAYDLTEKYFSEKEKERHIKNIAKNPEYSYNYAEDVLDKGQNVPDIILQGIAKNPKHSYNYAKGILKGQNVPDIIIQGIAKGHGYSYNYAEDVLDKGQKVPDIIVQSIAKSSEYSYDYAKFLSSKGQNVDDIILQGIAKDPGYSCYYAVEVLKGQNVPDIIVQSIAKSSMYSYQYAKDVVDKGQKVDDIILQGIAKGHRYSYDYAVDILKGQNVPDIIVQSIAKNPEYSYYYAKFLSSKGQNVPDIILQSIAEDPEYSYQYARDVLKGQNVPDIILQGIAQNSEYSYNYARDVLKGQNVPDIILQGIAQNSEYSYNYAVEVLNGQNVPDIIVQSIAKDSYFSYSYAEDVLDKGQKVPDIIVQSIAKSPADSYYYAKFLSSKGQKVDDIILQRIAKSSQYSYEYAKFLSSKGQKVDDIILQRIEKISYDSYQYAKFLSSKGQNVPDIILQSIAEDPEYSYQYARDVLKGQNVPDIILQSIAKDPKYAQKSLTEATLNSLSTIKSFKEYFYAFLEARAEIVDQIKDAINKVEDRPFGELFGNKDRFLIKVWNPQFEKAVKNLDLNVAKFDWKNRTYDGKNVNKFLKSLGQDYINKEKETWKDPELNKLLDSLFDDADSQQILDKPILKRDEYKFTRNQNPELDIIGKIKQAIDQNNMYYYLMFSRHPVDVLRMSDHKGISSCHRLKGAYNTTEGDYANCALADASNDGGIVYLIRGGDAKKIKNRLDEQDVFQDKDRAVAGIRPLGRIRLRRFIDVQTGKDWAVPTIFQNEQKYGTFTQELYKIVLGYCQTHQDIFKDPPDQEYAEENIVMLGGDYSDEPLDKLLNIFFRGHYSSGSIKHKSGHHIGWQEEMDKIIKQSANFKFHKITMAEINADRTVEFAFEVDAPVGIIKTEDDLKEFDRLQKQWDETYTYKAIARHRPIIKRKLQIVQKGNLAWTVGKFRFILNDPEEVNEYIRTFVRDEQDITEFFNQYLNK